MRKYGFFHAFFMQFFSKAFYRDVGLHWKGTSYLFLMVLLLLCWLPMALKIHLNLGKFAKEDLPPIVAKVPDIEIKDGVLTADCEQPYEITIEEDGKEVPVVMIDTTGEHTSLQGTEHMMLVTRDKLYVKESNRTKIHDLSQVKKFKLDQAVINLWVDRVRLWFAPAFYGITVLCSLIYRMLASLVFAAIGLIMVSMFRVRLTYESLIRLSVMAMTPVILAGMVHGLLGSPVPGIIWWFMGVLATLGFLALGIKSCQPDPLEDSPALPSTGPPALPPTP